MSATFRGARAVHAPPLPRWPRRPHSRPRRPPCRPRLPSPRRTRPPARRSRRTRTAPSPSTPARPSPYTRRTHPTACCRPILRRPRLTPLPTNADGFVSVSTAFYPGAPVDAFPADTLLVSADAVVFYAHAHRLLAASTNGFGGLLSAPGARPIDVAAHSSALNIAVHALYDLPFAQFSPPFDNLTGAVGVLALVGALGCGALAPDGALYTALLAHAPLRPLDVYALAGAHKLSALATAASAHLHTLPLASLTDDACGAMGAVYLKRLFFLHLGRADALKRLLGTGPPPHAPVLGCSVAAQQGVARAWASAAAYLGWTARADLSTSEIADAFAPLAGELACAHCRAALEARVDRLKLDWSRVKTTI